MSTGPPKGAEGRWLAGAVAGRAALAGCTRPGRGGMQCTTEQKLGNYAQWQVGKFFSLIILLFERAKGTTNKNICLAVYAIECSGVVMMKNAQCI